MVLQSFFQNVAKVKNRPLSRKLELLRPEYNNQNEQAQPTKFNSIGDSEVWKWWSQYPHVPYPSSLHVTVEPVNPPQAIQPSIR